VSQDNPWNLTQIERRAIQALTQTGSTKAAARLLAVDGLQISQALVRIRKRMGVANTILAVLAWDKWVCSTGRCDGMGAQQDRDQAAGQAHGVGAGAGVGAGKGEVEMTAFYKQEQPLAQPTRAKAAIKKEVNQGAS
jgi:hypothetical protein